MEVFERTQLIEEDDGEVVIKTRPKQSRPRTYVFRRVGDAWVAWAGGDRPTWHVTLYAEKNLNGVVSDARISEDQTSIEDHL